MVWHLSPCYIFCITFKEKYFFRYILLTEQIPLFDCLYYQRRGVDYFITLLLQCWTTCVMQLFFNLVVGYDVKKFENNLVYPHDLKVGTKVLILKEVIRWNKKAFFIIHWLGFCVLRFFNVYR